MPDSSENNSLHEVIEKLNEKVENLGNKVEDSSSKSGPLGDMVNGLQKTNEKLAETFRAPLRGISDGLDDLADTIKKPFSKLKGFFTKPMKLFGGIGKLFKKKETNGELLGPLNSIKDGIDKLVSGAINNIPLIANSTKETENNTSSLKTIQESTTASIDSIKTSSVVMATNLSDIQKGNLETLHSIDKSLTESNENQTTDRLQSRETEKEAIAREEKIIDGLEALGDRPIEVEEEKEEGFFSKLFGDFKAFIGAGLLALGAKIVAAIKASSLVKGIKGVASGAASKVTGAIGETKVGRDFSAFRLKRERSRAESVKSEPVLGKADKGAGLKKTAKGGGGAEGFGKGAGKGLNKFLTGLASGLKKIGGKSAIKGAATLTLLASSLLVTAVALKKFAAVPFKGVMVGFVALGMLVGVTKLLAKSTTSMIKGAAAIAILGAALIPAAAAFQMFSEVKWSAVIFAGVALAAFGAAVFAFGTLLTGPQAAVFAIGAAGVALLGAALIPFAAAANLAASAFTIISDSFTNVAEALNLLEFKSILKIGLLGAAFAALGALAPLILIGAASMTAVAVSLATMTPLLIIASVGVGALGGAMVFASAGLKLFGEGIKFIAEGVDLLVGSAGDFISSLTTNLVELAKNGPGLFVAAGGIAAVSGALIAFGASSAIGGLMSFFSGNPLKKFLDLAEKAHDITAAGDGIRNISDASKEMEAETFERVADSLEKLYKVLKKLQSGLFKKDPFAPLLRLKEIDLTDVSEQFGKIGEGSQGLIEIVKKGPEIVETVESIAQTDLGIVTDGGETLKSAVSSSSLTKETVDKASSLKEKKGFFSKLIASPQDKLKEIIAKHVEERKALLSSQEEKVKGVTEKSLLSSEVVDKTDAATFPTDASATAVQSVSNNSALDFIKNVEKENLMKQSSSLQIDEPMSGAILQNTSRENVAIESANAESRAEALNQPSIVRGGDSNNSTTNNTTINNQKPHVDRTMGFLVAAAF